MELINIADLKNPETGKTYREENTKNKMYGKSLS
jgi:hypothetical protein